MTKEGIKWGGEFREDDEETSKESTMEHSL
jgi:hypothetical protein